MLQMPEGCRGGVRYEKRYCKNQSVLNATIPTGVVAFFLFYALEKARYKFRANRGENHASKTQEDTNNGKN